MPTITDKKIAYRNKLIKLFESYPICFTVNADNVTSKQIQTVRAELRGKAEVLFGKNTLIRRCIRDYASINADFEKLLPIVKGNVGFVFTEKEVPYVREVLKRNEKGAAARAGAIAPLKVTIPAGLTGLEPTQTSFFQVLNIPTKITKGQIEMLQSVDILQAGDKVTASQAALLNKLGVKPFSYRLVIDWVLERGSLYPSSVLDITDDDIVAHFSKGVSNIAAIGLALRFPLIPAVPHMFINAFKNVLSIGLMTDYSFEAVEKVKAALAAGPAVAAAPAEAKQEAAVEEEEEEEEEDMGFDLFD